MTRLLCTRILQSECRLQRPLAINAHGLMRSEARLQQRDHDGVDNVFGGDNVSGLSS